MPNLYDLLGYWSNLGVFDILLPFLLIFAIVFSLLDRTKVLGDKKNVNLVVAFVVGILFLRNDYFVFLTTRFLSNVGFALLFFIMLLLVAGTFFGPGVSVIGKTGKTVAFVIAFATVVLAVFYDMGSYASLLDWWRSLGSENQSVLILLGAIIGVGALFTMGGGNDNGKGKKNEGEGS